MELQQAAKGGITWIPSGKALRICLCDSFLLGFLLFWLKLHISKICNFCKICSQAHLSHNSPIVVISSSSICFLDNTFDSKAEISMLRNTQRNDRIIGGNRQNYWLWSWEQIHSILFISLLCITLIKTSYRNIKCSMKRHSMDFISLEIQHR